MHEDQIRYELLADQLEAVKRKLKLAEPLITSLYRSTFSGVMAINPSYLDETQLGVLSLYQLMGYYSLIPDIEYEGTTNEVSLFK